jgi:hypothetical protein
MYYVCDVQIFLCICISMEIVVCVNTAMVGSLSGNHL